MAYPAATNFDSTIPSNLTVEGNLTVNGTNTVTGTQTFTGGIAVNGGATFDTDKVVIADTTGATTLKATLTVGVNDTGHDVKFFGATAGKYLEWDESADQLDVTGNLDVTGPTTHVGTVTVGVDDTGHDVKFYGATAGKYMEWDESADQLDVTGNLDVTGPATVSGLLTASYGTRLGVGNTAGGIAVLLQDSTGAVLFATTTTDPTTISAANYAKGCMIIKTDVASGTGGLYLNKGDTTTSVFSLVTQA